MVKPDSLAPQVMAVAGATGKEEKEEEEEEEEEEEGASLFLEQSVTR